MNRYYRSNTNRMASPDSIIPQPTNPQSLNRYSYTRNNPINRVDPTGHRECEFDDYCGPPSNTLPQSTPPQLIYSGPNAIASFGPLPTSAIPSDWRSTHVSYRDIFGAYATKSAPTSNVYIYYRPDAFNMEDLGDFERIARSLLQENEAGLIYDDDALLKEYAGTWPQDLIATAYIQFNKSKTAGFSWDKFHDDYFAAKPRLTLKGEYSLIAADRAHWIALGVEQGWLYDTSWGADHYGHHDRKPSSDGGLRLETTLIGDWAILADLNYPSLTYPGWTRSLFAQGGPYLWSFPYEPN